MVSIRTHACVASDACAQIKIHIFLTDDFYLCVAYTKNETGNKQTIFHSSTKRSTISKCNALCSENKRPELSKTALSPILCDNIVSPLINAALTKLEIGRHFLINRAKFPDGLWVCCRKSTYRIH